MAKKRLDLLLLSKGIATSREEARSYIMEGKIYVNGQKEDKPGSLFLEESEIDFKGSRQKYASRGGLKLEKALSNFPIDLNDKVCMDIGASTGGFTDCMLQNGAKRVYAIDVGYGQLAWRLREDSRVVCMEKTNFRYLTEKDLPESPDFASADVSFISLDKILPPAHDILKEDGEMLCLIKPQFEAGRDKVGKKGVVKDPQVHEEVIARITSVAVTVGFSPFGLLYSPIRGPEGNIEYLLYLKKPDSLVTTDIYLPDSTSIAAVVKEAHEKLV